MKNTRLTAILLCALMLLTALIPSVLSAETIGDNTAQQAIIKQYFASVDGGDWTEWAECYVSAARESVSALISKPENFSNNVGMLTVKDAEVISIKRLSNDFALSIYQELTPYYESGEFACYGVCVDLLVNEDNGKFSDGLDYFIMTVVKESGDWYVGSLYKSSAEEIASGGTRESLCHGFADYIPEPATIDVLDDLDHIHTVSFDDFIFHVVGNEIGNEGYNSNAIYAQVIAAKMVGWWMVAKGCFAASGYDVRHGFVAYPHESECAEENEPAIRAAVDHMDGIYMVTSTATGGKLFYSAYLAGDYNNSGHSGGKLMQNGSNYLAKVWGYDWKQILHYYYDNSAYNNTSVGTIQIKHTGSHSYGSYQHDQTSHWRICWRCEYKPTASHTWTGTATNSKCSVCGRLQNSTAKLSPMVHALFH